MTDQESELRTQATVTCYHATSGYDTLIAFGMRPTWNHPDCSELMAAVDRAERIESAAVRVLAQMDTDGESVPYATTVHEPEMRSLRDAVRSKP